MRRVVITGMGIVSSLGDTVEDVLTSLQTGKSGIRYWAPTKNSDFALRLVHLPK